MVKSILWFSTVAATEDAAADMDMTDVKEALPSVSIC